MKTKLFYTTLLSLSLSICTSLIHAQIPNYIPSNGLIGWWPFNGNANDESGNGNNGTVNGAVLVNDRFGSNNNAYSFNGNNNYIRINNTLIPNTPSSYSISLWYNTQNFTAQNGNPRMLISDRNTGLSSYKYTINLQTTGQQLTGGIYNGTGISGNGVIGNAGINNNWHNVVFCYNSSNATIYLYIDGNLMNSTSNVTHWSSGSNPTNIGYWNGFVGASGFFDGKIDDLAMWNRALNICEIRDVFNAKKNSLVVNAGSNQTICNGDSTVLSASGASTYTWNNNIINNQQFTPTISQTYSVVGIDTNGCIGSDSVSIDVLENSTSTQTISALDNYLWPINNQTYTQSGTYTQIIPNSVGCDSTITLNLTLSYSGVNELNPLNNITIQPNPTSDFIYINGQENFKDLNFIICDLNGQQVLKDSKLTSPINIQKLPKGIYFLEIKSENNTVNKRIVKQ